ncbi:hypothetical protein MMC10_011317 [Thelotrema lepadinum]|nr:hypothetical protein [Thelotrema lepadinum]
MDGDYGRIHRVAFRSVLSILFGTAVLATMGRVYIRLRYQKRLFVDDYVLLFGCVSLIAAFTLTNIMFEDIYFDMSLILGPTALVWEQAEAPGFEDRILSYQQLSFSDEVLCWLTIYAVKTSFLLFFRQMIDRLGKISIYWKVTLGLTVISGIYSICNIFISCPHFGVSSIQCAQGSGMTRTDIISQFANALDIITDIMVVAIPICLLLKVKIRLRQKILLGCFLCLSVFMVAVCLVRAIGETIVGNTGTTVDVQWNVFWAIVEACVAVIVVSLTAFRSLYGIKSQQTEKKKKRYEPWLASYRRNLIYRKKTHRRDEFGDTIPDTQRGHSLPSIPGATLTGMRTMIRGMPATSMRDGLLSVDEIPEENPGTIRMTADFDVRRSMQSPV